MSEDSKIQAFLVKARAKHGDKYDYSKVVKYEHSKMKLTIKCPLHGEFIQRLDKHIGGHGCQRCGELVSSPSTKQFINLMMAKYGDKYDYSKIVYTHSKNSIIVICPQHGEFEILAKYFQAGQACRECYLASIKLTTDEFIKKSIKIYGDKFDYSLVECKGATEPVILICNVCNYKFTIIAHNHTSGRSSNCEKCSHKKRIKSTEAFIKQAITVHKGKYGYEFVDYKGAKEKVLITCYECSVDFLQTPDGHVNSKKGHDGCRKYKMQELTRDIFERILESKFVQLYPDFLCGLELDGYNEQYAVAFEYQGVQHYKYTPFFHKRESDFTEQQNKDYKKRVICEAKGIRLIEVSYLLKTEEDIYKYVRNKLLELDVIYIGESTEA